MRMGLKGKIFLGYIVLILFLAVIGFFSFRNTQKTLQVFDGIHEEVLPNLGIVDSIKSGIAGQANDERGFLLTGEEKFVKEMQERAAKVDEIIEQRLPVLEENEKEIFLQIEKVHKEFTAIQKQVVDAYKSGNMEEAKRLSLEVGRDKRKNLDPLFAQLEKQIQEDLEKSNTEMHEGLKTTQYITAILLILAIVVGLGLGLYLPFKITAPIKAVVERSKKMAAGDFSVSYIDVNTRDEIRDLAESFNVMIKNVRELLGEVLNGANEVAVTSQRLLTNADEAAKSTQQVAGAIQEVAKGIANQTTYINETSETVNQVNTAIRQIADGAGEQINNVASTVEIVNQMAISIQDVAVNAQTVALSADKTRQAADKGEKAVKLTIEGMNEIKEKVFETANKIKELGEHSQQIGEIIQVIDDIAEQTNLLALNAAIEAARAGEHGKGFAVVADEVRKLAERSSKATKEIADLITNIQKLTAMAVAAMEAGTGEVEKGSNLALDAGNALKEILATVEETYQQVQNISAAAEEISASSQDVVKAIDNVSAISHGNTAATEQLREASKQVALAMENIAAVTQQSSASAEEVSASTEEMTAAAEAIANAAGILAETADRLSETAGKFKMREITENCWDIMNCSMEVRGKCPAYKSNEKCCWLISGTWCGGVQQGDAKSKRHRCMNCEAFKVMNKI
ncbi:methyl-accepting chemotaxis sensory transducer [Thermincola ferriacetica]|uniref:Methyl-accepting chemotaxis sensory transducer n=1 Tax=Thermincola ferriacetica TaxID=281456 RepID=A0A0L6W0Z9_9FIRM|nr:methyl-accepting chemotaxis protein [Thermincola ferriacetica]KNZ69210.1 methyl-accepting chemotaxis sensory transducer [Thermincola ferriacetica]